MAHFDNKVRKVELDGPGTLTISYFFEGMNPTPYCMNELARLCNKVEGGERMRSRKFLRR